MPDEGVADDIHLVAQDEIHIGIRRTKIIAAGPRMDVRPLQIVLRRYLVELFLDQGDVAIEPFLMPVAVAGRNGAVDGRANQEMVLVGGLERLGLTCVEARATGQQGGRGEPDGPPAEGRTMRLHDGKAGVIMVTRP